MKDNDSIGITLQIAGAVAEEGILCGSNWPQGSPVRDTDQVTRPDWVRTNRKDGSLLDGGEGAAIRQVPLPAILNNHQDGDILIAEFRKPGKIHLEWFQSNRVDSIRTGQYASSSAGRIAVR